jgi:hypothetical protein
MDKDETDVSTHPLDQTILQRFAHWRYDALFVDWEKTKIRLDADRDGAVTAARALIETTAKVTLDEMGVPYQEPWDLPKIGLRVIRLFKNICCTTTRMPFLEP